MKVTGPRNVVLRPSVYPMIFVFNWSKIALQCCVSLYNVVNQLYTCVCVCVYIYIPSLEEGNGNPLQYSCLENPMDGGAW